MKLISTTKIQKTVIVVACVGFFSVLIYMNVKPDLPKFMKKDVSMTEKIADDGELIIEVEENVSTIEKEFPLDMTNTEIRAAIHSMTHQKVVSQDDEKWGKKIPLTQDRVKRLLDILAVGEYENEKTYFEILKRWEVKDFSKIARDHNSLWYMDGGTIGYATGIMSPEDEAEYISLLLFCEASQISERKYPKSDGYEIDSEPSAFSNPGLACLSLSIPW
ncbi:DUF6241 domain-containing protein [Paenisporosarcina sp. TG20]|uniref:DUF6241 domain-containing protein n=1 Tax=Paenisporosarcina sp. TG20 TaxID=1211706 RepID=UPI0002D4526A|nr:DUF6241 domain-containing protein [Paenisporosarcina sp. TG20]